MPALTRVGGFVYPVGWHPLLSMTLSFPAYLFVWRLEVGAIRIPVWVNVAAMAFWAGMLQDVLIHGTFWLYHFRLPWSLTAVVVAPTAAAVSLARWRRPWLAIGGAVLLFTGITLATVLAGWTIYEFWNIFLSALQYLMNSGASTCMGDGSERRSHRQLGRRLYGRGQASGDEVHTVGKTMVK
jgi:hypothetical protein